jgi:hypothetical protein
MDTIPEIGHIEEVQRSLLIGQAFMSATAPAIAPPRRKKLRDDDDGSSDEWTDGFETGYEAGREDAWRKVGYSEGFAAGVEHAHEIPDCPDHPRAA